MLKTGIFGGSFNPIHNGHISLARQLKEKAGLDEVWLMVSPQNPMKKQADLLSDEVRFQMACMALEHEKGITASDYEMHLPKPSYTWLTLQALSREYPDRQFVLMIGGDNWTIFDKWYHADDILRNYQVVVYPRRDAWIEEKKALPASVMMVEAELLDISSTEIRRRIREGRSIRELVPPSVAAFIKQEGYYV
jgi:nicotinate-nucleotide adenylyltransferase